jgi:hypothetical protein
MKKDYILGLLFSCFYLFVVAQNGTISGKAVGTVPNAPAPLDNDVLIGTHNNIWQGTTWGDAKKTIAPAIITTPLTYNPPATGNVNNRDCIVTGLNNKTYYIDPNGKAKELGGSNLVLSDLISADAFNELGLATGDGKLFSKKASVTNTYLNNTAPANPKAGDVWIVTETTGKKFLRFWNGTSWLGSEVTQETYEPSANQAPDPLNPTGYRFWSNTFNNEVWAWGKWNGSTTYSWLKIYPGAPNTSQYANSPTIQYGIYTSPSNNSQISFNLVPDAITNTYLADNAVQNENIQYNAISSNQLQDAAVTPIKLATNGIAGYTYVTTATGVDLVPTSSITSNISITTTDSPTLNLETTINGSNIDISGFVEDGSINTDKLTNGGVYLEDLANGSVNSDKIVDLSVDNQDLKDACVNVDKIADLSIIESKIANNAVVTSKIADDAISADKIDQNAVNTGHIEDATIMNNDIADLTITASKLTDIGNYGDIFYYDGSNFTQGPLSDILCTDGTGIFKNANGCIEFQPHLLYDDFDYHSYPNSYSFGSGVGLKLNSANNNNEDNALWKTSASLNSTETDYMKMDFALLDNLGNHKPLHFERGIRNGFTTLRAGGLDLAVGNVDGYFQLWATSNGSNYKGITGYQNSLYANNIASGTATELLYYNTATGEIKHGATPTAAGDNWGTQVANVASTLVGNGLTPLGVNVSPTGLPANTTFITNMKEKFSISDMTDVAATAPTNGQTLVYNSTSGQYVPSSPAGVKTRIKAKKNGIQLITGPSCGEQLAGVNSCSESYDVDNNFDAVAGIFTVARTGYYLVNARGYSGSVYTPLATSTGNSGSCDEQWAIKFNNEYGSYYQPSHLASNAGSFYINNTYYFTVGQTYSFQLARLGNLNQNGNLNNMNIEFTINEF